MYNLLSGLIGVLISVMIVFNGTLSRNVGNYLSLIIIHCLGLFLITLILLIRKIKIKLDKNIPLFLYSAGAIGIFTVLFNNISFNRIGTSLTLSLGLLGQSLTSIFFDHYGLFNMKVTRFRKEKLIGILIIFLGILVMTIY